MRSGWRNLESCDIVTEAKRMCGICRYYLNKDNKDKVKNNKEIPHSVKHPQKWVITTATTTLLISLSRKMIDEITAKDFTGANLSPLITSA